MAALRACFLFSLQRKTAHPPIAESLLVSLSQLKKKLISYTIMHSVFFHCANNAWYEYIANFTTYIKNPQKFPVWGKIREQ